MGDDERHPSSPGRCHKQGSGLRTRSGMSPLRNRRPRGVTGSTLGSGAPASSIFTLWAQRMPRAGPGWAPFSRARAVGLWELSACSFRAAICPVSIMGFPGPAWDAHRALGPQPASSLTSSSTCTLHTGWPGSTVGYTSPPGAWQGWAHGQHTRTFPHRGRGTQLHSLGLPGLP